MSEGDLLPQGSHRKNPDPKRIQKIKEGGKRADQIHKQADAHHKAAEVPVAEQQLMKDLEEF